MNRMILISLSGLFLCGFQFGTVNVARKAAQDQKESLNEVVPRGDRVLGVAVTDAETEDFMTALDHGLSATGFTNVPMSMFWDNMETAPGVFLSSTSPQNFLVIANAVFPPRGVGVALAIPVLDSEIPRKRVPADLAGMDFDDPVFISRFKGLLDWMATQIPNLRLDGLSIGNESDVALGNDNVQWTAYKNFYDQVAPHARSLWPGIKVGSKLTFTAVTETPQAQTFNQNSDVIMVNYYPLNPDFTMRDPGEVLTDIERVLNLYPGRTVFLTEAGYASGPLCDSSENRQAEFVDKIFSAWDAHPDRLKLISFTFMTDLDPAIVAGMDYGVSTPEFLEYLGTLGLRTFPGSGTDKRAFQTLSQQARKRGW